MEPLITGLHHVTALASDPQRNVDFYAGILGLRLVKKTVNFDAPEVYHLYFGDERGSPGTIMTFFPYVGLPNGRKGKGQLTVTSFSIAESSLDYWIKRFEKFKVTFAAPQKRLDEQFIYFEDFDGLGLELVAHGKDSRPGFTYGTIPLEHAIKGFYGITLAEEGFEKTADLLMNQMNHRLLAEAGNRYRFSTKEEWGFVDILCSPDLLQGRAGSGTVHHVAFATASEASQLAARAKLEKSGVNITPVIDRQYFHSVYFREPGGVLFEIATLPPGFIVDELIEKLGEELKLPPREEPHRSILEKHLPPLKLDQTRFTD